MLADLDRPWDACTLLGEDDVVGVEIAEVRRRHRAELLEQPQRETGLPR